MVVHGTNEPNDVEIQSEFGAFTFKQKETKKLQNKLWNNKSEKVMDNLSQLYPYL